jgi:hypothetical protein
VGSVTAKNKPSNTYNYTDANAVTNAGASKYIYYRLKIYDKSVQVKYSEIARISLDKTGPQITIGPNVFNDFVTVNSSVAIKEVFVYDMNGKLVYQTSNIVGNKILFANKLPAGMYLFKMVTANGIVTRRLVKG